MLRGLRKSLVVARGIHEIRTPVKNHVHSRDTRTRWVYMYNVTWKINLGLLSLIPEVKNNVYKKESKY